MGLFWIDGQVKIQLVFNKAIQIYIVLLVDGGGIW